MNDTEIINSWRSVSSNLQDDVIWKKRKATLNIIDDDNFKNYLLELKAQTNGETETNFLSIILEQSLITIKKASALKSQIKKAENVIDYSLMTINAYANTIIHNAYDKHQLHLYGDKETICNGILVSFIEKIKTFTTPTLAYEYEVYLNAFEKKDNRNELLDFVCKITNSTEWLEYFFESYPVLLKIIMHYCRDFKNELARLFSRLASNYTHIVKEFNIPPSAHIIAIKTFLGDPHRGWQTTSLIEFIDMEKVRYQVYYKPRNLEADIFFNHFLTEIENLGFKKSLNKTEVINKEIYGWQKGINYTSFTKEEHIRDFFFAQGQNLAIAYMLNIQDLIADNIIISNDFPVFFDLEMILVPKWKKGRDYKTRSKAGSLISEGVLKTGILPSLGFEMANQEGHSNSGISKVSGNRNLGFKNNNGKRKVTNFILEAADTNLPIFKGEVIVADNYCPDFEEGFKQAYLFFYDRKEKITEIILSLLKEQKFEIRTLARLTYMYASVLTESYNPKYLSNYFEYHKLLELYWRGYDKDFLPESVIQDELHQLLNNEVPYYFTYPSSKDLYNSKGEIIVNGFFELSGIESLKKRLYALNTKDMQDQLDIIRRSLITHNNYSIKLINEPFADKKINPENKTPQSIANLIGDYLLNLNCSSPQSNYFTYVDFIVTKGGMWTQDVQHFETFQGTEGLGIFFTSMYSVSKEKKYLIAAQKIFHQSIELLKENKRMLIDFPKSKIGLSNFPVSTLYYSCLGNKILNHNHFNFDDETFSFFLEYVKTKAKADEHYCYLSGSTGLILLLIKFYENTYSNEVYKLLLAIGNNLVKKSIMVKNGQRTWERASFDKWGGFSHGNSSTSYALFKIANITGNEIFHSAAIEALQYDQGLFIDSQKAWGKSIDFEGEIEHGWGNGSAGIGLSRLLISNYYVNDFMKEELYYSKKNMENYLPYCLAYDHSICSGVLGILEIQKLLDQQPNLPENPNPLFDNFCKGIQSIGDIRCGGWEKKQLITGLFYGIAGVGYNILKTTTNKNLPSLLYL